MANKIIEKFSTNRLKNFAKQREKLRFEFMVYLFFPVYLLLAGLFWSAGFYGRSFFVALSLGYIFLILMTMGQFVMYVANVANKKNLFPGLLFAKGVFFFVLPIVLLKLVSFIMITITPIRHPSLGILCDSMALLKRVYFSFGIQQHLSYLLWGSVILLAIYLLDVLRRKS